MDPADIKVLEDMAFLAELARPLAHETNNFLNNLLLQLAISEKAIPEPYRSDWRNIRSEGEKLADLLQQWQRQRKHSERGPGRIDLNQVMQDAVAAQRTEAQTTKLVFAPLRESAWIRGFMPAVSCLCSLLVRVAVEDSEANGAAGIEFRLERIQQRILFRLVDAEATSPELSRWSDFEDVASSQRRAVSLPALCCRSLVDHLGGSIRIEKDGRGRMVLVVDLPLAF
jgi:signal transduction histidine kinase